MLHSFAFALSFIDLFPIRATSLCAMEMPDLLPPQSISEFVLKMNPARKSEFCGNIVTKNATHYLFALTHNALTGFILVRSQPGLPPAIESADTAFPRFFDESFTDKKLQAAVSILVRPREMAKRVSAIGARIDEVVGPLANFWLRTNSSLEILRLLKRGAAYSVDPGSAPPGAIIVSPTTVLPTGRVAFGHAGILGFNGAIYSADTRFGGAWTQNYTLKRWENEFSPVNGTYTFVLRATCKVPAPAQRSATALPNHAG
jgi:hypothetical protein